MVYHWLKRPRSLVIPLVVLAILFTLSCGTAEQPDTSPAMPAAQDQVKAVDTTAPTAAPVAREAPVSPPGGTLDRVVVAIAPIGFDTNYSYKVTSSGLLDKRPVMEWLIDTDRDTGQFIPQLATSWELSPDGTEWTIKLREGIQWQGEPGNPGGWGEFTAQDVGHSLFLMVQPDSRASNVSSWRLLAGVEKGDSVEVTQQKVDQMVEVVDDHTLVIRAPVLQPELDLQMSIRLNWVIESKARWDAIGDDGYGKAIVGTGPLKFIERVEGVRVLYETVDDHWRVSPDYKELEFRWASEPATRLATLLTGEVQMSDLERAARPEALNRGMKIVSSTFRSNQHRWFFGGQYYTEPEKLDADLPWLNKKVRQAMNKAVNRDIIVESLLQGSEVRNPNIFAFDPVLDDAIWPGIVRQDWFDRWDEMYGYDPVRAKELLVEAGYPEGFAFDMYIYPLPGLPEMVDIGQAMALDYEAIGLKPNLISLEFPAVRKKYRSQTISGQMWPVRGASPTTSYITAYLLTKSTAHAYQVPEIDALWDKLGQTLDRGERTLILQEIGDIVYDNFGVLQMFALSSEIVVDPKFIAEYKFPGNVSGFFTHLEHIKTVPQ